MDEVRPSGWSELHEALFEGSWHADLRRFRSSFAYRGEADASTRLTTSLARLGGAYDEVERHLVRSFRRYAGPAAVPTESVWNWLALGKHHGLPTRLLDWTYSPSVALHFATADAALFDRDGVVWCVDYVGLRERLPAPLRQLLEDEGADAFTAELLDEAARALDDLDALAEEDFVVFLEPPSLDERIVNQYALFSLMSSARAALDAWLDGRPELVRRVLVPAELKWEVRDKLDQANVTERVLFPGLDGLSAWLTRYYSPRTPGPIDGRDDRDARTRETGAPPPPHQPSG